MKNRNYKNQAVPLSMGVFDLLSGNQKNGEAMNNRSGTKGTGLSVIEEKQESPRPLHSKTSNSVMKGSRSASRSRPFGKTGLNSNGVSYNNDRQDSSDDNVDTRHTKTVTFKTDVESLGRNSSSSDDSNGSGWSNKGGNSSATESEYSTTSEYSPRNESKAENKPSHNDDIMSSTTNTSSYGSSNNNSNNNTSSTGTSNNNSNDSSSQGMNNNSSSLGVTDSNSTSLPSSDNSSNNNNNTSSNNNSTSSGQNNNTPTYASSSISTSSTGSRDGRSTPSGSSVGNASERGTYNQRTGSYTRDQGTGTDTNVARSGTPARTRTPTAQSAYAPPKSNSYSGNHHQRTNSNQPNSYGNNNGNWNNSNNNNNRGGNNFRSPQRSNTWDSRDSGDWSRPEQKAYDQGMRIAEDELKNMSLSEVRNHSPRNSGNFTTGYNDRNNNNNNSNNNWGRDHSPPRGGWSHNDRGGYGNDRGYNNNRDNYNDRSGGYGNSDRGYGNVERGYNDRNDYSNDRRGGGWNDRGNHDRYDRGRGNNYSPPSPPPKKSGFDADRKMDVAYEAGYKDALERVKADMMRQFGGGNNSRNNNRW